ncbi:M3 family oligoendopeptidase [Endozoicomonas arenosclerae]|uniref:M3 family oligoendopeptidase n=1 Tax=Endozoicomonas arenosclerae TaxID=1633495 RepID=UPI0007807C6E|nr:M3 family oligoendopeptidase [Endozoicomonas arenosclerae]
MTLDQDQTIPVWNNLSIYSSLTDPKLDNDFKDSEGLIGSLKALGEKVSDSSDQDEILANIVEALGLYDEVSVKVWTVSVYAQSFVSVDARNEVAARIKVKTGELGARIDQAFKPIDQYVIEAPESFLEKLLSNKQAAAFRFYFEHERKMADHRLSTKEEVAVSALSTNGLHGWGRLYSELAGQLKCDIDGQELGLASAFNLTLGQDAEKRRLAWEGIQSAWKSREETVAAILNAINGWRSQEQTLRSAKKPLHYLDVSCHSQCIEKETLNALMEATDSRKSLGHRALKGIALGLGVEKLGPQDLHAPCPVDSQEDTYISFEAGIKLVSDAFSSFDTEMGEFALQMYENGWIDAKPSESRSTGAYCTRFENVREPRVFMTWDGAITNVITLAHELGHAWHNWVMKDMPLSETRYPMTLAETASIFAETLVRDALFEQAETDAERMQVAWQDAERAAAFLNNIPARFEFEKRLAEGRKEGYLSASELTQMMESSWEQWYGDSISGYDSMFWASKLHFSISGLSFYNYPYLFGYLFSLGVYAQKDKMGSEFKTAYRELLKDTGTMTAEDLIRKHLDQDITQPEFWLSSLSIVEGLVEKFEQLIESKK